MAIIKRRILGSTEIHHDGKVGVKHLDQIYDEDAKEVLSESPHRQVVDAGDTAALDSVLPDDAATIKQLAGKNNGGWAALEAKRTADIAAVKAKNP